MKANKIRIWDTRICAKSPVEEFKHPNFSRIDLPEEWTGYKPITNATKLKYVEDSKTLVANFTGGNGLFTFDIRKKHAKEYYNFHYYPVSAFDTGDNYLKNIAVSAGTTSKLQFDLRISDITVPFNDHDKNHYVMPGHKAIISK